MSLHEASLNMLKTASASRLWAFLVDADRARDGIADNSSIRMHGNCGVHTLPP